jgi:hypothetical protein
MSLPTLKKLCASTLFFASTSLFAAPLVVDFNGVDSTGEFGDPGNTVLTYDIGANSLVTRVSYSIDVTAYNPSWLTELGLAFTNSALTEGVLLRPAEFEETSGNATYADTLDLVLNDLSFFVGNDGILRLEFYEEFDDVSIDPDGRWNFGTITFDYTPQAAAAVPEPASALLLGGGALLMGVAGGRRRSSKAVTEQ